MLDDNARKQLLKIARLTVEEYVKNGVLPQLKEPSDPQLLEHRGAFVTLTKQGALRGCIGTFFADKPLYLVVRDMAKAAATEDPRFAPVVAEEIPELDIEISALTPLRTIKDPEEIEVGRHGIYIIQGPYRGVLLPQVATEYGWNKWEFLDQTCWKAGLNPGCWKDPQTTIKVFEAEVFDEKELGLK